MQENEIFEFTAIIVPERSRIDIDQPSINSIYFPGICTLSKEGFIEIRNWMDYFDQFWNSKLKNLETLLNQKKNAN